MQRRSPPTRLVFNITHEFLSVMLGVRRSGVTVALNLLERTALISINRGVHQRGG
jgi:CRP-like cAMP-binding protein